MTAADAMKPSARMPGGALPADERDLPDEVRQWLGHVVIVEEGAYDVAPGLIETFCAAVEDGNPLYRSTPEAQRISAGRIAPPAMLAVWARPALWAGSTDRPISGEPVNRPATSAGFPPQRRPLELHFRLKEIFRLPKAVVIDSAAEYYEPVRPGDRLHAEQMLDEVEAPSENRLGKGRRWTVGIRYRRRDGVLVGSERLRFFAYDTDVGGSAAEIRREATPAPGGEELPPLSIAITARHVIMGAAASCDWQPQHHDHRYAVDQARLRGIILNTPSQSGWLSRYLTDWSGPEGRIARLRLRMVQPICPGDVMQISGNVDGVETANAGWRWLRLRLRIRVAQEINTDGAAIIAVPGASGLRPWEASAKEWSPPDWNLRSLAVPE